MIQIGTQTIKHTQEFTFWHRQSNAHNDKYAITHNDINDENLARTLNKNKDTMKAINTHNDRHTLRHTTMHTNEAYKDTHAVIHKTTQNDTHKDIHK